MDNFKHLPKLWKEKDQTNHTSRDDNNRKNILKMGKQSFEWVYAFVISTLSNMGVILRENKVAYMHL